MTILRNRADRINRADEVANAFEQRYPECSVRIDYAFDSLTWIFIIERPDEDNLSIQIGESTMMDDEIDVLDVLSRAYDPGPEDIELEEEEPVYIQAEDYTDPVRRDRVSVSSIFGQNPVDVMNIREGQTVYDFQGNPLGVITRSSLEVRNDIQPVYRMGSPYPVRSSFGQREMRISLELSVTEVEISDRALNVRMEGYVRGDPPVERRTPVEATVLRDKVKDVLENKPEGFSIAEFFNKDGTV